MALGNRRDFLRKGSLALAGLPLMYPLQVSVNPVRLFTALQGSYGEEFPDMLLRHLAGKLNALARKWDGERQSVRSSEDARKRSAYVREQFRQMIGGLPERTPLNPVVTGVLERADYRVEKVMFQSRPDFWVTASLYIPSAGSPPFPAILCPNGHYADAGRAAGYQRMHQVLVKSGFVVLTFDPVGQGERRQFWDSKTGKSIGTTIDEHSTFGQLLWLLGESLTQYRGWDVVRAVDYLVSRPEVDAARIGCSGHSGGGADTIWAMALDERIKCAAPIEPGGYHWWPLDLPPGSNLNPGDAEHNFFPAALRGVDLCDLYQSFAPKPLMLGIETYANKRFQLAAEHLRQTYRLYNAADRFSTVEATDAHYWTMKLRLAVTDWFSRRFYNRPGPAREPGTKPEPVENLYCTPTGSLIDARRGETVGSLILRKQEKLPPEWPVPNSKAELESFRERIRKQLTGMLVLDAKTEQPLGVRLLASTPRNGFTIEKLEFLSEPGIYIPTWVFVPENRDAAKPVALYVGEQGTEQVGHPESGWGGELAEAGHMVIAVDVRGMGQTAPPHASPFDRSNWSYFFDVEAGMAYMCWSMGESLLGMRVRDVIRAVDYARSRPEVDPARMVLIGSGMGAVWALLAAALDPRIASVVAENGLVSYKALAQASQYKHAANVMMLGVLKRFDLPHVAAAVAGRSLTLISPVNAMKRPIPAAEAVQAYEFARETYAAAGASQRFSIVDSDRAAGPAQRYGKILAGWSQTA